MTTKVVKTKILSSKGKLSAVIHYPKNETGKLAILCSGYLDSKDYKHLTGLAEALNAQGYAVVRFDATGIWESEGDISEYTTTQYLEDIKHVLDFMLKESNYGHILLGGHSRGGQVAILYAARDPRISAVLSIMPSSKRTATASPFSKIGTHHKDWKETGFRVEYRNLPDEETEKKMFRVPYSHAIDKDKYDVVEDVKKVTVPILFIAGELDDRCPPDIVKEIFDNANEPKSLAVLSGIGHDYRHNDSEVKFVNKEIMRLLKDLEERTR